jgi:apolipoprotein D and lipocalin family protein
MKRTTIILGLAALSGLLFMQCQRSIPEKASPISNFDLNRYLGKWYEIARLDFKHEKNLNQTTASYSLNEDGTVKVVNRGFDVKKKEWKVATGKAKFRGEKTVAALKVSFFGPFYSGYNVLAIDEEYQYALVAGKSLDYLWILARTPEIPADIKARYLQMAEDIGYTTSDLVWIQHN